MRDKRPWLRMHDDYVRAHPEMTATAIALILGHHSSTVQRHARALGVDLPRTRPLWHARATPVVWDFSGLYRWSTAR